MEAKTAVICDDDVTLMRIVEFVLTKQGFTVFSAGDGGEGLEMIRAKKPGFLILDLEMPVKDGLSVLKDMQSQAAHRPYTMVLSVHEGKEKHDQVLALGANEVLVKPFNPAEFVKRVERLIREGRI